MKSESKSRYATKKPGKTEVEPLRRYEDMYNLMEYFKSRKMWDSYLTFMFGLLLGRRIGDTVMVKWSDFYYENGRLKTEITTIEEQKTGKTTIIPISQAVKGAIAVYCRETGVVPQEHLHEYVFNTPTKTEWLSRRDDPIYQEKSFNLNAWCEKMGKDWGVQRKISILEAFEKQKKYSSLGEYLYWVVEYADIVKWQTDGFRRKFATAVEVCNVEGRVSCHSLRKTFGWIGKMIHPDDPNAMETLQEIFNHVDVATTTRYIGLSEERKRRYFDDMGEVVESIESGNMDIRVNNSPIVSLKHDDLREVLMFVLRERGGDDIEVFNRAMNMIEEKKLRMI